VLAEGASVPDALSCEPPIVIGAPKRFIPPIIDPPPAPMPPAPAMPPMPPPMPPAAPCASAAPTPNPAASVVAQIMRNAFLVHVRDTVVSIRFLLHRTADLGVAHRPRFANEDRRSSFRIDR
jgi:hypothetical protein